MKLPKLTAVIDNNAKLIVSSSEGECDEQVRRIEDFARSHMNNESPVLLRPPEEHDRVISLYLDNAEFTEWKCIAYDGGQMSLVLDSKYVVVPADVVKPN